MATAPGLRPRPPSALRPGSLVAPGVAVCVALAVAVRAPYAHAALGLDEGGVAAIARQWPEAHGSLYGAMWLDRPPVLVGLYKVANVGGPVGIRVLGAVAAAALVVLVAMLALQVGGRRAAVTAAAIAAALSGSVALLAVYTPAELLAVVPSTASVLCLVVAHRRGASRWLALAGVLAVSSALIKQSFLDAGLAGAAFLAALAWTTRRVPWRDAAAYAAGAVLPLAGVVAWQATAHPPGRGLAYALVGFRVAGLHTLAHSNVPLLDRLRNLWSPAWRSGLAAGVAAAPAGLVRLRRDRVVCVALCAWLAGAMLGVAGGGSYWPHYLIQLVPVVSVAAAVALAAVPDLLRRGVIAGIAAGALVAAGASVSTVQAHPPHREAMVAGEWLHAHARPGDTQYVLYAHANVGYYSGLPSPYPYAWSLMVRAIPGAIPRLDHLLASSRRPTWLVRWQRTAQWGLDPHGVTASLLRRDYVRVAGVGGHPILLRRDVAVRRGLAPSTPGRRL